LKRCEVEKGEKDVRHQRHIHVGSNKRRQATTQALTILEQVFSTDPVISITIKLPEPAIQDIKVLVTQILGDLVDVFFVVHLPKGFQQIRSTYLTSSNASGMTLVQAIKDACNDVDKNSSPGWSASKALMKGKKSSR
jgi:hypothetical protein